MSAHTPGPWVASEWDGETCCVEALTPDGKMVTREICHVLNPEDDQETTKANLNLIAASPDLLTALRGLLEVTERGSIRTPTAIAREAAHVAIAKARGAR